MAARPGTVDLNGYNQTVNALSGLVARLTTSPTARVSTMSYDQHRVNAGYAGVISDNTNSGRIALVVEGAGTNT